MTRLPREAYHTVQVVPVTAFDERGELNLKPMRIHTRRLLEAGVRCFIPCAGSSEFHSLSAEEIAAAIGMTREVAGQQAAVVAPVGLQLRHAIDIGRRSLDAGADSVLVMPLDFPYLSDDGARDYYLALLEALDCPAMIYKKGPIPSDRLLLELADHPRVIGVKHAVNDIDALHRLIRDDGGRIDWYCGSAERFAPFYMLAGSPGYTSGAANLCPRVSLALHAAATAGDWSAALRWQQVLRPIEDYRARDNNSFNISFLKYAVRHTGLDFGQPRPPQRRLSETQRQEIDALVPSLLAAEAELAQSGAAV